MRCTACGTDNPLANKFCRSCGAAMSGAPTAEADRRQVTVLFADMSGSTAMGERLDPEEVQEIMSVFYQELAACVHRYGGTVDKFLGDGIMALFGAPRAHEDDPERALATALEMRQGLRAINQRLRDRLPTAIGLHIGVNTGLVVTGRVGDTNRSDYTVLGDTVNLAARLEDKSEDGQILVSESTWRQTRHAFAFQTLPPVQVKGKAEPVPVYELRGRRARRESRRGLRGLRAPMVGRASELARLTGAVEQLQHGTGGVATVVGAAGVGKSRLLSELRLATRASGVRWVEAACASLGLGGALSVWAEALRRLLGMSAAFDRGTVATRLTQSIAIVGNSSSSASTSQAGVADAQDAATFLAHLLRLDLTSDDRRRLSDMNDAALRDRLFIGVRDLIEAEARRRPLVLVIDDLHWCDSASMQLLSFVLPSTTRVPLLLITAMRGDAATIRAPFEEAIARATPPFHVAVDVQPLTDDDSGRLAEALLGEGSSLDEVRRILVDSAAGNPLFLEEVLRSLIDQGVVRQEETGWVLAGERGAVVVPETLQGLLLDRIDRLPEASKRLVQIAAVVGRVFPSALVGAVAGAGTEPLSLLTVLEQDGYFERVEGPCGGDYSFRHALMQEAAYASLLHRHRRDYHRRAAEWYEQYGATVDAPELAAILAHHWERAEGWERAAHWALHAADQARHIFALDEADALYHRALQSGERAGNGGVQAAARLGLGEALFARGALAAAAESFGQALEQEGDPLRRAMIERRIGQALDRDGQHALALAAMTRALGALGGARRDEEPERTTERARIVIARAVAHLNRGDEEQARTAAEAALRLPLPAADRADATALLGALALRRGDIDHALRQGEAALGEARTAGDLLRTVGALTLLADAYTRSSRYDDARHALDECLTILRRLGDQAGVSRTLLQLAAADEAAGAFPAAVARLELAIRLAESVDEPMVEAAAWLRLGRVRRLQGDWPAARAALDRAGGDDPDLAGRAALELSLLALDRNELPEAELRQAMVEGDRHGIDDLAGHARIALATLARRRKRTDEARDFLRQALVAAAGREDEITTAARIELAELTADEGKTELAVTNARMALHQAERTGPAILLWRAQRRLGVALAQAGALDAAEPYLRAATEAARAAGAAPELARCLGDWARVRTRPDQGPDPAAHAMLQEMRVILASLTRQAIAGAPGPDAAVVAGGGWGRPG